MRKLIVLPCFALLAAAALATSAAPALTNQVTSADTQKVGTASDGKAVQAAPEKKICKLLPSTGSRLPNRACLTAKEWKQVEADLDQ